MAAAVDGAIEGAGALLGAELGHGLSDPPSPQRDAKAVACGAGVAGAAAGADARPTTARSSDGALVHQPLEAGRLVLLTRSAHEGQGRAGTIGREVHPGREAALAAPQRLGFWRPPLCTSGVLVRAEHAPIDDVATPVPLPGRIGLRLDGGEDPLPAPGLPPAPEPAGHGRPGAVPFGKVPPRRPGPLPPHDAVDDLAMVGLRATRLGLLGRERRFQPLPLRVGALSSVSHTKGGATSAPPLWSLCVQALLKLKDHDVIASRDINSERLPDDVLLLTTVRYGRIFITHNRIDFRMLHDAWVTWPAAFGLALPPHPGILVLDAAPPEMLARVIADFLDQARPGVLPDAIFWWHRRDGWDRSISGGPWEPYQPPGDAAEE